MTSPARAPRTAPHRSAPPSRAGRRDHLRVVPPPGRPTGSVRPAVVIVAMVVVFGSLLAAASFHAMLVSGQSHLDDLETRVATEREALARDRLVLADLQSPSRIAEEAEAMGMVPAERRTWLSPGSDRPAVVTGDEVVTDGAGGDTEVDPDADATTGSELADAPVEADAQ